MFLGVLGGATAKDLDPERERDPPLPATPVIFPRCHTNGNAQWSANESPPDFRGLFSKIVKPADVTQSHLDVLNVDFSQRCSVDELLPSAVDGSSYFPDSASDKSPDTSSYADAAKIDPAKSKKRKDFDERLAEVKLDNDVAFRVVTRTTQEGVKPPRVAYMRKFWDGLESMSQYWDCSRDEYYEIPYVESDDEFGWMSPKRARLDSGASCDDAPDAQTVSVAGSRRDETADGVNKQDPIVSDESAAHKPTSTELGQDLAAPTTEQEHPDRAISISPVPKTRTQYRGRRINNGRHMPDQFRNETIKAFVEGVVWPFSASISAPRRMPLVQINKLNLPIRQTALVCRLPNDRAKARLGFVEGPIMGIQVRADTEFEDIKGEMLTGKARLDLMRELGGLLQLAQERRREGKSEVKPGEGQWWTERPRWGGGPGGEVGAEGGNAEVVAAVEETAAATKGHSLSNGRERRRRTPALLWKEVKCGSGFWDPKTNYTAVGKDPRANFDEVFMVSSLFHHISILKLTVHDAYLDFLEDGRLPEHIPTDPEWCRPKFQRSQWFDLFDVDQRVAAFCALWAIMAYLTRPVEAAVVENAPVEEKVQPQDIAMSGT